MNFLFFDDRIVNFKGDDGSIENFKKSINEGKYSDIFKEYQVKMDFENNRIIYCDTETSKQGDIVDYGIGNDMYDYMFPFIYDFPNLKFFIHICSQAKGWAETEGILLASYRIYENGTKIQGADWDWKTESYPDEDEDEYIDQFDHYLKICDKHYEWIKNLFNVWLVGDSKAVEEVLKSMPEDECGDDTSSKYNTVEEALEAVQKNGFELENVPDKLKTLEVCLAAVQDSGYALEYVPDNLKTEELCIAAVQNDADALEHIPDNLKTAEIYLLGITSLGTHCKSVPEHIQSEDFFIQAVKVNTSGKALMYIPHEFRTLKVCNAAVQLFPEAMEYVPDELKSKVEKVLQGGSDDGDDGKDLEKAKAFDEQGNNHIENDDFAKALECFTQAIKWCPDDAPRSARVQLLYSSGYCYARLGEYQKAITNCKKALELEPDNEGAKEILARCEKALKNTKAGEAKEW